jgi:hypothetical protein
MDCTIAGVCKFWSFFIFNGGQHRMAIKIIQLQHHRTVRRNGIYIMCMFTAVYLCILFGFCVFESIITSEVFGVGGKGHGKETAVIRRWSRHGGLRMRGKTDETRMATIRGRISDFILLATRSDFNRIFLSSLLSSFSSITVKVYIT